MSLSKYFNNTSCQGSWSRIALISQSVRPSAPPAQALSYAWESVKVDVTFKNWSLFNTFYMKCWFGLRAAPLFTARTFQMLPNTRSLKILSWKYKNCYFLCWKNTGSLFWARKKPLRARSHTLSIFDTYILYFWYIEDLYRGNILRREQPSGVVQGLGIWRWWVRFPPPRGQFGVTFSRFFGCLGKCLGGVRGPFWTGLGRFWKKCPTGSENENFQNWPGVFSLSRAASEYHF